MGTCDGATTIITLYNAPVEYRVPESVRKYADMAFAAKRDKIDHQSEIEFANLREQLAAKGLPHSSVTDRETARLHAERVNALVQSRADSLIEGYELHDSLDENAGKAVFEEVTKLRDETIASLSGAATDTAKMQAWRTRSSSPNAIAQAQEFGRLLDGLTAPILNEIGCEIERRRLMPRTIQLNNKSASMPAAVRPVGPYTYHPEIQRVSQRLCEEGNFRQAVLDAFIHVIHTVREKTGLPYDGDDLMNRAFSTDGRTPPARFNNLNTEGDKNEQRGIWYLFKGIVGLRNSKAHVVNSFDDPHQAHEYLALASLLMRLLDSAIVDNSSAPRSSSS